MHYEIGRLHGGYVVYWYEEREAGPPPAGCELQK
jgi:hypothetical protein